MTLVKLDRRGDRTIVTLDRPESLNALSPAMLAEMRTAVESVAASDARVLIIQGEGRAFSAGADLKAVRDPDFTRDQAKQFSEDARAVTHLMETMPQVVIARVHGFCFTGAFEIMLAADFILASEDAVFADTHTRIGRTPAWGLSQRLPRLVGIMRAKAISLTARRIPASEAVAMGLILGAAPLAELDDRVAALADMICENDPLAIAGYKNLFRHAQTMTLDDGLAFEAQARYPRTKTAGPTRTST